MSALSQLSSRFASSNCFPAEFQPLCVRAWHDIWSRAAGALCSALAMVVLSNIYYLQLFHSPTLVTPFLYFSLLTLDRYIWSIWIFAGGLIWYQSFSHGRQDNQEFVAQSQVLGFAKNFQSVDLSDRRDHWISFYTIFSPCWVELFVKSIFSIIFFSKPVKTCRQTYCI